MTKAPTTHADLPVPRQIGDLPGPRSWPLVGNVFQLDRRRIHQSMEKWARIHGKVFRVRFGPRDVLVVSDSAAITAILRDRPDGFRRPAVTAQVSEEMGGLPGIFTAEGAQWRDQRRMVMAAFAPHAIKAYFPSLIKVALRLQARWDACARAGTTIDLEHDLKRYTVDIIAGLAFGTEVNTIEAGEDVIQQHLDRILPAIARRSVALFPYWRYVKLPSDRRLDRSIVAMRDAVGDLIIKARARMAANPALADKPSNLLEAMIGAADREGSGVDDRVVAGNVQTMLLAGEDTTAHSIAWLLYLLSRNPQALARAQDEVRQVVPETASFTIDQMDSLDFLDACIKESMRLKPVAPFLPLETLRETKICGVHVPADTIIWCVLRGETVDDAHISRAAEFDPERWLVSEDGQAGDSAKRIAMPFGSGPRMCPGRYLALLEIKIAAAMLLARFALDQIETPGKCETDELMGFVMSPVGLRMRLKPR